MNLNAFFCRKFYYPADAYNRSKLAQVLFTKSIQKLCKTQKLKIQVHSVHPGIVNTDLFENCNSDYFPWVKKIFYKTPSAGAIGIVYAAISPKIEGQGGTYISNCTERSCHKTADDDAKNEVFFNFSSNLLKIENFGN